MALRSFPGRGFAQACGLGRRDGRLRCWARAPAHPSPDFGRRVDAVDENGILKDEACVLLARRAPSPSRHARSARIWAGPVCRGSVVMPSPNAPPLFRCPSCNALYQVVKAEAGPETVALEIACRVCSRPLVAREGQFVLKYFLLRKAIPVKDPTARRARPR
jgi:hypothetical protein